MMGTWQVNFNGINQDTEKFMEICRAHPSCINCPLKTEVKEINGVRFICHTGRGEVR